MGTLERYMIRLTLGPLGFFVIVLTGVVWLTQSLRIIDIVVNNNQGARVFLEFSVLLLPTVLSIVLQLGALAATIYMLHLLITDSELSAAFAGGFSKIALTRPIAVVGLGVMAVLAIDTLYLMPTSARVMRDRLAEIRGDIAAGLIRDGRFLTPGKGLTVYIREIAPDGQMHGVLVKDASDPSKGAVTYTAKKGILTQSDSEPALILFNGQAQQYDAETGRLSILRFDRLAYDLSALVGEANARHRKPSERYFYDLIDPPAKDKVSKKAYGKLIAEGHEQLSAPLYGLALPMIAAAVMLGAGFSRRGVGGSVAIALAIGALVRVGGMAAKSSLSNSPELWPTLYAIPILAILVSLAYLIRSPAGLRGRSPSLSVSRARPAPGE